MNRRGFLGSILAAAAAPAIVRAESLMRLPAPVVVADRMASFVIGGGTGLVLGDVITIAGVSGSFVINAISDGGVVNVAQRGILQSASRILRVGRDF